MQQQPRASRPGPERFILALALLLPLGVVTVALAQIPGIDLRFPSTVVYADAGGVLARRPAPLSGAPPPTLAAPPTATPVPPTPTAVPTPVASPTPVGPRTYTVRAGDELKNIAADYHVSIWNIIAANDIPNPDSLRVGQQLEIPPN
jgi:LysM repeat protein